MIRIPNFTKSESFDDELEAKVFQELHENDSDIVHWTMCNGTEFWVVYYEKNGYYEYDDPN